METIFALIESIPDVIWAAVIASLLTLSGVLATNRGSYNRLIEQLKQDKEERDKERKMDLRRNVYLEVAEAINANHMILMKLSNLQILDSELSEQFSDSSSSISKVYVIGASNTVKAVSELSTAIGTRYLHFLAKRRPLVQRKYDIDIQNNLIEKSSAEKDRMIAIMKEINLQGISDDKRMGVAKRNFEFEQKQSKKYTEKRDELIRLNTLEQIQFAKGCFQASQEVSEFFIPAINAIREEMEIPFDKEGHKETMERAWQISNQSLGEFFKKVTGNNT